MNLIAVLLTVFLMIGLTWRRFTAAARITMLVVILVGVTYVCVKSP